MGIKFSFKPRPDRQAVEHADSIDLEQFAIEHEELIRSIAYFQKAKPNDFKSYSKKLIDQYQDARSQKEV